eukprot:1951250-Karenia_brevis.AAC.1
MDGWMDGWMDGGMDGWMDGMDGLALDKDLDLDHANTFSESITAFSKDTFIYIRHRALRPRCGVL